MDQQELARRLMTTFLEELDEHVQSFNRDLLALESDPADEQRRHGEILKELQRTAHTLKGAARSVNLGIVEAACHGIEEILSGQTGTPVFNPGLLQLLFSVVDAIAEVGGLLRQERPVSGSALTALLPSLTRVPHGQPVAVAAEPASTAPRGGEAPVSIEAIARLPVERLDALLSGSGNLLVARRRMAQRQGQVAALLEETQRVLLQWRRVKEPLPGPSADVGFALEHIERELDGLLIGLRADQQALDKAAAPLEHEIHRVRMVPFAQGCDGLARMVRDLARSAGKEVEFVIEGGDVELDRAVLQALRDPLLHMVRNAVDHGAELPAERQARGKPRRVRILVRAALRATGVEVTVEDDGRGLDLAAITEHARRRNLTVPGEDADVPKLVFLPGFSTASQVTELSGRGVGLDVVRSRVESIGGRVELSSEPGRRTCFTLVVPLTLGTMRAVLVRSAGQTFALSVGGVAVVTRAGRGELRSVEGQPVLLTPTGPVPALSLAEVLGVEGSAAAAEDGTVPFVMLADGERRAAFAVEALLGDQELVVKTLGRRLRRVRFLTGATILPSGRVALILSPAELVRSAHGQPRRPGLLHENNRRSSRPKRVLVVDDSVTARTLERSILEAAGYEVSVAADGAAAWRTLQSDPHDVVVADVDMPEMDGFELTEAIKRSPSLGRLRIVLVSARESDEDKRRGLQAGADAYLPKSTFERTTLLQAIAQLS